MGIETAIIGALVIGAAVGTVGTSVYNDKKGEKKQENLAGDSDVAAKKLADEALAADALAAENARQDALKRLRARTQTVFTTPLGLQDTTETQKKVLLGSNNTL